VKRSLTYLRPILRQASSAVVTPVPPKVAPTAPPENQKVVHSGAEWLDSLS
jgi:hypothetical protein